MGSHLCTKIILQGTFFFLYKYYAVTFLHLRRDKNVFHHDMIIVKRVFFIFILPLLNEIIVFSR